MTDQQRDNPRRTGRGGWTVVRLAVAVVLLGAAVLKAHELITRPVLNQDILSYRWSLAMQVLFELGLGLALALDVFRRFIWLATVGCFIFFCFITIYKGVTGEASCGCFGVVQVNPWYTLILDVAIVVFSLAFRPPLDAPAEPTGNRSHRRRLAVGIALFVIVGVPVSVAMFSYEPSRLARSGDIIGDEPFVVLDPETWVGRTFPLLRHIEGSEPLAEGRWTVVLFAHDCPGCGKLIPQLVDRLADEATAQTMGRLALVEVPPYGPSEEVEKKEKFGAVTFRLSDRRDWFVGTPTVLMLQDGTVTGAKESATKLPGFVANASPPPLALEWLGYRLHPSVTESGEDVSLTVPVDIDRGIVEHDFGSVDPESVHKVVFEVRNTTDAAIGIRKVTSECTCMTAEFPKGEVPPGETMQVIVTFAAPKKPQIYDKRLLLFTTKPRPGKLILRIKARVGTPLAK